MTAMPTSSFSWLHLTDFHYGLKGQDCLWPTLREPFLDSLAALHDRCGPWDAVFFTGDLVQSGETAQFEKMQAEVLDPLWEKLREIGSGNAVLLAVPGNHDLYRPNPNEDNAAIDTLLEKDGFQRIEAKFWDQPTGRLVHEPCGGDQVAVGRDGDRIHATLMALQCPDAGPRFQSPKLDSIVLRARNGKSPVGRDLDRLHGFRMPLQRRQALARFEIPQPSPPITMGR
jgi:hypothetical protein